MPYEGKRDVPVPIALQKVEEKWVDLERNAGATQLQERASFWVVLKTMVRYSWTEANWRSKVTLGIAAFALTASKGLAVSVPFALQRGVDAVVAGDHALAAKSLGVYCAARLAVTLTSEVRSLCYAVAAQEATRRYARKLFDAMHELGSSFHSTRPTGFLSVAFSRGARGFQTLLGQLLFSIGPTFIELALSAIVLAEKFGAEIGGITLLTFAIYAMYTAKIVDIKVKVRRRIVDLDNAKNAYLVDSLACHETVKAYDARLVETRRFDHFLRRMVSAFVASTRVGSFLNIGQAAIFSAGLATALLKVAETAPTVGDVVAVNALLLQLAQPMNFLGYTISEIRQSLVDVAVTQSVLDERETSRRKTLRREKQRRRHDQKRNNLRHPDDDFDKEEDQEFFLLEDDAAIESATPPALVFRDVTMKYDASSSYSPTSSSSDDAEAAKDGAMISSKKAQQQQEKGFVALRNCSFEAKAGEVTVLAGQSGSGKSTALRLAARLDTPNVGEVYYDYGNEKRYRAADLPWRLRQRASFVPQEALLFDETASWNVQYGALDAGRRHIEDAVSQANVDVSRLPRGLDSRVGERGQHVSGGQRQRLAIARALVRNPSVALADEPTSGLDAVTERDVLKALVGPDEHNRTLVVVAHRLAAVAPLAHKIVVFKNGTVVQAGSHDDLLQDVHGEYFRLWTAGAANANQERDDSLQDDEEDDDKDLGQGENTTTLSTFRPSYA